MEEASLRELEEELRGVDPDGVEIVEIADGYPVEHDPSYTLYPVLMEMSSEQAENVGTEDLSREHSELEWIDLVNFGEYDTPGQYPALEKLGLVNGEVSIGVVRNNGDYLAVKRSDENTSSGYWTFVSGQIEEGESPEEAAVREIQEETGLEASPVRTGDPYIGKGETGHWRLHPVLLESGSRTVELNWELSEHCWSDLGELRELETLGRWKAPERLEL